MAGSKIVEIDYYDFQNHLRRARDSGCRILPSNGQRWTDYIKANGVNVIKFEGLGKAKFEEVELVAIDGYDKEWDGCYVYSDGYLSTLKWQIL